MFTLLLTVLCAHTAFLGVGTQDEDESLEVYDDDISGEELDKLVSEGSVIHPYALSISLTLTTLEGQRQSSLNQYRYAWNKWVRLFVKCMRYNCTTAAAMLLWVNKDGEFTGGIFWRRFVKFLHDYTPKVSFSVFKSVMAAGFLKLNQQLNRLKFPSLPNGFLWRVAVII